MKMLKEIIGNTFLTLSLGYAFFSGISYLQYERCRTELETSNVYDPVKTQGVALKKLEEDWNFFHLFPWNEVSACKDYLKNHSDNYSSPN